VPRAEYDPDAAEIEAQAILLSTRSEAAAIVQGAKETANSILDAAILEAETLRKDAIERGTMEGFERAKAEVEAELSDAWDERISELRTDVQQVIDTICEQRKVLWEQTEQEILGFVVDMSKRVVKVELQQNNKVIGEMIRHALRRVADKDNVRIRVCPDELEAVRADRKDLLLILDGARQLEIIDDRRIGRGGCVIETSAGTVDARVDTQFEQIVDKIGVVPLSGDLSE
jgi:flagellar assembly protein FliH